MEPRGTTRASRNTPPPGGIVDTFERWKLHQPRTFESPPAEAPYSANVFRCANHQAHGSTRQSLFRDVHQRVDQVTREAIHAPRLEGGRNQKRVRCVDVAFGVFFGGAAQE